MPRFALPLLLLPLAPCAPAQILADFEISLQDKEFGRFTVQFDHYNSPHAAANFIRLAEGLVPWLDGSAGKVRKEPFYDGLTFHSVTAGVEIAGGSRTGNGDDNPGWTIRDDFTSPGGGTYTMFMENDGPNSNGSRFFINLPATINANPRRAGGHYTAVGRVLQATTPPGGNGRLTVAAIANSAPGFHLIDSVKIRYLTPGDLTFRRNLLDPDHFSRCPPLASPASASGGRKRQPSSTGTAPRDPPSSSGVPSISGPGSVPSPSSIPRAARPSAMISPPASPSRPAPSSGEEWWSIPTGLPPNEFLPTPPSSLIFAIPTGEL